MPWVRYVAGSGSTSWRAASYLRDEATGSLSPTGARAIGNRVQLSLAPYTLWARSPQSGDNEKCSLLGSC
jgi:hypothetical protein